MDISENDLKTLLEVTLTGIFRMEVEFEEGDYKEQFKKLLIKIFKKEEQLLNAHSEFLEIGEYISGQVSYSDTNKGIVESSANIILNILDKEINQIKAVYYTIFEALVYFDFCTVAIENTIPNLKKAIEVIEKSKTEEDEDIFREIVDIMNNTINDNRIEDLDDDEIFELLNDDLQINILDKPEYKKYLKQ